jgi:hypothetical protein
MCVLPFSGKIPTRSSLNEAMKKRSGVTYISVRKGGIFLLLLLYILSNIIKFREETEGY